MVCETSRNDHTDHLSKTRTCFNELPCLPIAFWRAASKEENGTFSVLQNQTSFPNECENPVTKVQESQSFKLIIESYSWINNNTYKYWSFPSRTDSNNSVNISRQSSLVWWSSHFWSQNPFSCTSCSWSRQHILEWHSPSQVNQPCHTFAWTWLLRRTKWSCIPTPQTQAIGQWWMSKCLP